MRWTPKPPLHIYGSMRRRLRFALLPTLIEEEKVWLEFYWAVQKLVLPGAPWCFGWLYKYRIVYEAVDPNLAAPKVGPPTNL